VYASYTSLLRKGTYVNHRIATNPSTVTTVSTIYDGFYMQVKPAE